ncbi:MAG: lytic transglycosylase F [Rhodospirillales bacterium]
MTLPLEGQSSDSTPAVPPERDSVAVPGQDLPWTGDLEGMVERHLIRVLVAPSKTGFFYDGPRPRGLTYERVEAFEAFLSRTVRSRPVPLRFLYIPVAPDQLLPMLNAGYGDLVAADLLVTPELEAAAAFSEPLQRGVTEVLVTGPTESGIETLQDLSGKKIYVRPTSSHADSLRALNRSFEQQDLPPVRIVAIDEQLDDEALLQMVHAGLIGATVVQDRLADFWAGVLDGLVVHGDLALSHGGDIAWAVRKDSPQLLEQVNAFVKEVRAGTLLGNVLIKRYLKSDRYVRRATEPLALDRMKGLAPLFKRYAEDYGFDWLWIVALAYQESRLDQASRSHRGAVGIMQILPATARSKPVQISDIGRPANNIEAGVKYLAFLRDSFFDDPALDPLNRMLFSLAAYNAGPERVQALRRRAEREGLDPNVWFHNVEYVAARRLGREPPTYVANVYIYYVAYRLMIAELAAQERAFEDFEAEPTSEASSSQVTQTELEAGEVPTIDASEERRDVVTETN